MVNRMDIRPGDRILLTTEHQVTQDEVNQLTDIFNSKFEGVEVLLASGVEVSIIGGNP